IGCPIIGDPKYFEADINWEFPGGIQNRLHLHARRIVIPHPKGGVIDVTAPLPPHMRQSWNLLGFDEASAEEGARARSRRRRRSKLRGPSRPGFRSTVSRSRSCCCSPSRGG